MMPVSKPFLLHARGHRAQLRTPHPVQVYDSICENQEFGFPTKIKNRIKNQNINKMSLPSSLSADIVECKSDGLCCKA
jgi:hypothetical protein